MLDPLTICTYECIRHEGTPPRIGWRLQVWLSHSRAAHLDRDKLSHRTQQLFMTPRLDRTPLGNIIAQKTWKRNLHKHCALVAGCVRKRTKYVGREGWAEGTRKWDSWDKEEGGAVMSKMEIRWKRWWEECQLHWLPMASYWLIIIMCIVKCACYLMDTSH